MSQYSFTRDCNFVEILHHDNSLLKVEITVSIVYLIPCKPTVWHMFYTPGAFAERHFLKTSINKDKRINYYNTKHNK